MIELQDLFDIDRNPTGELYVRGSVLPKGRLFVGVRVWVRDNAGRFLLSQRHPCKVKPLMWEPTGGAVCAGEHSRETGLREVYEEIGLKLNPEKIVHICTKVHDGVEFRDTYLACWNGEISELRFQENEVVDARWVTYEEMEAMDAQGILAADYRELFEYVRGVPAAVCEMRMEDYDEMAAMWKSTPGMGLNEIDDSREGIERFIRRNPGTSYVAKTADGIVGTVMGGHDGRRGALYHLAVLPEMRGSGIGRALVCTAVDAIAREGISKLGIHVFSDNEIGSRFWEQFGFVNRTDVDYRSYLIKK